MSQTSPDRAARPGGTPNKQGGTPGNSRSGDERKNARGESTRLLILTAAERLFAERGISAVPLRDIGIAAGQRSHAAVQYHFGDRDEVVKAIMEFRGAQSEASRTDTVADLVLGGSAPQVLDIVSAFVRPLAMHIQPDNHYLAFLSRLITEEGGYGGLGDVRTGASVITLRALLRRLLPQFPEAVIEERWWVTLTSAVHTLARYQSAQRHRTLPLTRIDVLIGDLVGYLTAGLTAPLIADDPRADARD